MTNLENHGALAAMAFPAFFRLFKGVYSYIAQPLRFRANRTLSRHRRMTEFDPSRHKPAGFHPLYRR
jgi:hypothetical protein